VDALVDHQDVDVRERLAADVAQAAVTAVRIARFLAGVHALVFDQVAGKSERLFADVASEGFVAGMRALVARQRALLSERLLTHIASVRSDARVDAFVLPKITTVRKHLRADVAFISFHTILWFAAAGTAN